MTAEDWSARCAWNDFPPVIQKEICLSIAAYRWKKEETIRSMSRLSRKTVIWRGHPRYTSSGIRPHEWRYKNSIIRNNEHAFASYSECRFITSKISRFICLLISRREKLQRSFVVQGLSGSSNRKIMRSYKANRRGAISRNRRIASQRHCPMGKTKGRIRNIKKHCQFGWLNNHNRIQYSCGY